MFEFTAYFNGNDVLINEKSKYSTNRILTWFLNADLNKFYEFEKDLKYYKIHLSFLNGEPNFAKEFNAGAYKLQSVFHHIIYAVTKTPLYKNSKLTSKVIGDDFIAFLNTHTNLFDEDVKEHADVLYGINDTDPFNLETEYDFKDLHIPKGKNKYEVYKDNFGVNPHDLAEFIPLDFDFDSSIKIDYHAIEIFNRELEEFIGVYLKIVTDVLNVQRIYLPFVNEYLHRDKRFLSEQEFSSVFVKYLKERTGYDHILPTGKMSLEFKVMKTAEELNLFESYTFDGIGAFLYFDFFRGVKSNHIPKKCTNCGKYFLLDAGKYSDYCETPLKDEPSKTCRDIGSRKKYDEKCKTDPIWLTYNRAYKAHYARYMKKKMTVGEFEIWSRYAVEIREKSLKNELHYDEYYRLIRK